MKAKLLLKSHLVPVEPAVIERAIKALQLSPSEVKGLMHTNPGKRFQKKDWEYWAMKGETILDGWRKLARTDAAALRSLAAFLLLEADNLKKEFLKNREHYLKVTTTCASWPGEMTVDKDLQKRQALYAKAISLGRFSAINYCKKQWSRQTPEVAAVLQLIRLMRRAGGFGMLPDLNRTTAATWWERAELFLEPLYGKDFENHQQFSHYWKNMVYKDQPKARALIRRDIKKQLKQAFRSIAPKSSTV